MVAVQDKALFKISKNKPLNWPLVLKLSSSQSATIKKTVGHFCLIRKKNPDWEYGHP